MDGARKALLLVVMGYCLAACGGGGGGGGAGGAGGGTPPPASFTVMTSTAGSGTGTISPGSRTVTQGNTTSFTISPTTGSSIASVTGCGGRLSGTTYTTGPIHSNCTVIVSFDTLPAVAELFQGLNIPGARSLVLSDRPLASSVTASQPMMMALSADGTAQATNDEDELGYRWYKVIEGGEVLDLLFIDQDGNRFARHISNERIAKCEGDADRCVSIEALLEIDQRYLLVAGALYFDPYAQGKYYTFLVDRESGATFSMALDDAAAAGDPSAEYAFRIWGDAGHPKVLPNGDIVGNAPERHFVLLTSSLGTGPVQLVTFPSTSGPDSLDILHSYEISDEYFMAYRGRVRSTGQPACRVIDLLDENRLFNVPSLLPISSSQCEFKRTETGRIVIARPEWGSESISLFPISRNPEG
jgi:hypothetical protein